MLLDELGPIDWDDFDAAASVTQAALRELVGHPTALRDLVYQVGHRPELLAKSECLDLDDKIVLYEALDRGFRLRLHVSKNESRQVPHDHRFCITTFILVGTYYHKLYVADRPLDESITVQDLRPVLVRDEHRGACYTMHHSVIESNTTAPGTMSLLLRGPTAKDRALAVDRGTGRVLWKYGEKDESAEQREKVRMSLERYFELRERARLALGWSAPEDAA